MSQRRLFVFAIGGTGCRVLRSLNFLLAAGVNGFDSETEIFPIIIDYDKENGDKTKTLDSINNYCKLRNAAYHKILTVNKGYFAARVRQMSELDGCRSTFELNYSPSNEDKQYKDNIGYDTIKSRKTKYQLESLYDDSLAGDTTELNIDMTVGFKGNPNIGSVVFHELKEKPEYKEFLTIFNKDTDRIMIIGSLFGGTGSSGIPELIMAMRDERAPIKMREAVIGTLMVLPYFSVQDQSGSPIHANLFNSKTKAALDYYEKSGINTKFNSIYYVGDRTPSNIEHNIGGKDQRNPANICELVGALSIIHFMNDVEKAAGSDWSTDYYKYAFAEALYGEANERGHSELRLNHFMKDDANAYVFNALCSMTMALKYFHDIIEGDKRSLSNVTYYDQIGFSTLQSWATPAAPSSDVNTRYLQDLCYYLHSFYDLYTEWLEELRYERHGHGVNFFNMASTGSTDNYGFHHLFVHREQVDAKGRPTIVKGDFDLALNVALHDRGHFERGKSLKENVTREYAFMDILRVACDTLLANNTKINI